MNHIKIKRKESSSFVIVIAVGIPHLLVLIPC